METDVVLRLVQLKWIQLNLKGHSGEKKKCHTYFCQVISGACLFTREVFFIVFYCVVIFVIIQ